MRCYKINPDKLKDYGFRYNTYRIVGYQYKQKPIVFIDFIVTDSILRYNVVKQNGDIVCYHFYNRNEVEDYLYENTRLEMASRSRYKFGHVFRGTDGEVYIRLNLQIRFKK